MNMLSKTILAGITLSGLLCSCSFVEAEAPLTAGGIMPAATPPKLELFLLVGQSNMAGRGAVLPEDKLPNPRIFVLNKEDQWVNQGEPIHFDKSFAGVGLGFTFAKQVIADESGANVGLIPCAVGGTPIRRWMPNQDLFEEAVRRAKIAMKAGELKGILWHQGESECGNATRAKAYAEDLERVAKAFRDALDAPDLPFIAGELGEFMYEADEVHAANARIINQQINTLPQRLEKTAIVSSKGLTHRGDVLHFNAESQKIFGTRYYQTYRELIH
jgi:hypothetical protein